MESAECSDLAPFKFHPSPSLLELQRNVLDSGATVPSPPLRATDIDRLSSESTAHVLRCGTFEAKPNV